MVLSVLVAVLSACASRGPDHFAGDTEPQDDRALDPSRDEPAPDATEAALGTATAEEPAPVVVDAVADAHAACAFDLDMTVERASYRGYNVALFVDASAHRYNGQAKASDIARMAWAAVQTWESSADYDAQSAAAVHRRLSNVGVILADDETVQHAWGGTARVVAFTSGEVAHCTGTKHGHMIRDESEWAEAHMHELMHGLSAGLYGDGDNAHKRNNVWNGLVPAAKKFYYATPNRD
jgi:hypothetical protein